LAKKQKKTAPDRTPTRHQRSKWQRQMRLRRIVIIAAVVFLVGIGGWVGYGGYQQHENNPLNQVVIDVNGVHFNMQYYISAIGAYANLYSWNSTIISTYGDTVANLVADNIISGETLRQAAETLDCSNCTVSSSDVSTALQGYGWPDDAAYQDIMRASLLDGKVKTYFEGQLPATMEQAHVQVVLVESAEAANEVIAQADAGGNFTDLASEFSCNSSTTGDLGWLPAELMPNTLIANAAFNGTAGEISQPIYDETAIKDAGYWLIEVTDKQGNQINARAMLLGSHSEAEQVKAELAAGGNFSSLAAEYSQYQGSNSTGQLGWITQGAMNSTAFDQVAFNLPLNQVSDPVKDTSVHTTGGYWLVNVVDRGNLALSDNLKQQLANNHYSSWLKDWSGHSTINTYLDPDRKQYAINQVLAGLSSTTS
jgi:parvulin-like peptidyl-prolyl isomerase